MFIHVYTIYRKQDKGGSRHWQSTSFALSLHNTDLYADSPQLLSEQFSLSFIYLL